MNWFQYEKKRFRLQTHACNRQILNLLMSGNKNREVTVTITSLRTKISSLKNSYPTHPIIHPPTLALNNTHLNSHSVSCDPLEIGSELTMDYPLDNPFDLSPRS